MHFQLSKKLSLWKKYSMIHFRLMLNGNYIYGPLIIFSTILIIKTFLRINISIKFLGSKEHS